MKKHILHKSYVTLEKKIDVANTELDFMKKKVYTLTEAKTDLFNKLVEADSKYRVLESKYDLSRSWNKFLGITTVFLGLTTGYLILNLDIPSNSKVQTETNYLTEKSTAPEFFYLLDMPTLDNKKVFYPKFKDDNALDMHAYAKLGSRIYDLGKGNGDLTSIGFSLPKDLIDKNCSFDIWAIDRNGNESKKKTLYTFNGYVSEKPIPK